MKKTQVYAEPSYPNGIEQPVFPSRGAAAGGGVRLLRDRAPGSRRRIRVAPDNSNRNFNRGFTYHNGKKSNGRI